MSYLSQSDGAHEFDVGPGDGEDGARPVGRRAHRAEGGGLRPHGDHDGVRREEGRQVSLTVEEERCKGQG